MARILGKRVPGQPRYSVLRPRPQQSGGRFRGLRTLIKRDEADGLTVPNIFAAAPNGVKASLATNLAGSNNDLVFESLLEGVAGNSIRVRYVVSGNNTPLSCTISGTDITVNLGTNNTGTAISTAASVMALVNGTLGVGRDDVRGHRKVSRAIVRADLKTGNDGTGVPVAMSYTALSGGVNGSDLRAGPGIAATSAKSVKRQEPEVPPRGPAGGGTKKVRDRSANRSLDSRP